MKKKHLTFFIIIIINICCIYGQRDTVINVNDVSFNLIYIKGGTFRMGVYGDTLLKQIDPKLAIYNVYNVEKSVTVSDFYIMETEVTQELWVKIMKYNPSFHKGRDLPVENVTWREGVRFCKRLNRKTGLRFRLPTKAEWEYAAIGGCNNMDYLYAGSNILDSVAWYFNNSYVESHQVKQLKPNQLGLYDMSGNVGEWCLDISCPSRDTTHVTNPQGPGKREAKKIRSEFYGSYDKDRYKIFRVVSGGYFSGDWSSCVPSVHGHRLEIRKGRNPAIGFRVVLPTAP